MCLQTRADDESELSYPVVVDLPYGPRSISGRHQVSLPPKLMTAIELTDDDEVFLAPNLDLPGTIVVIPARLVSEVFPGVIDLVRRRAHGG